MDALKMKRNATQSRTIPLDIFPDVCSLLLDYNVAWQVEAVNPDEETLLLQIQPHQDNRKHGAVMDNISSMLEDYNRFRNYDGELQGYAAR